MTRTACLALLVDVVGSAADATSWARRPMPPRQLARDPRDATGPWAYMCLRALGVLTFRSIEGSPENEHGLGKYSFWIRITAHVGRPIIFTSEAHASGLRGAESNCYGSGSQLTWDGL